MLKSYTVGTGKEAVGYQAPVIATITLEEPAPDPAFVAWLSSQNKVGEKGLVLKRIGGVALICIGVLIALFSLIFFPGLLFWFLGFCGLGVASLGMFLMLSKRTKTPEEAFRVFYKEGYFNGGEGVSTTHTPKLFNDTKYVKKRVESLCPIEGLVLNEEAISYFSNNLGGLIGSMFTQYGRVMFQPNESYTFAVFCDPDISVTQVSANTYVADGVVNVARRNSVGDAEIAELRIKQNLICLHGFYLPINMVPALSLGAYQQPQLKPATQPALQQAAPRHSHTTEQVLYPVTATRTM